MQYSEKELQAFVGTKGDYFVRLWRPILWTDRTKTVPLFAPGVFHFFWLCYRGLLLHAVLVAILAGVLLSTTSFLFDYFGPSMGIARLSKSISMLIVSVLVSIYAGRWYLNLTLQKIDSVRKLYENEHDIHNELRKQGGPQWLSLLLGSPLCLALAVSTTLGITKVLNLLIAT